MIYRGFTVRAFSKEIGARFGAWTMQVLEQCFYRAANLNVSTTPGLAGF